MTQATEDLVIEIDLVSATKARAGTTDITAGDRGIRAAVSDYALQEARAAGRPATVVVTGPTGKQETFMVGRRPGDPGGPDPKPLPSLVGGNRSAGNGFGASKFRNSLSSALRGSQGRFRDRPRDRREAGIGLREFTSNRWVRGAVVATGIAAGFVAGSSCSSSDGQDVAGVQRPLDVYSGSGPGDTTSGPGVIQASAYAYYTYPRTAAAVSEFWVPGAAGTLTELQELIDQAAEDKLQHSLAIHATTDPMVYDVELTLTTSDRTKHPYWQRFRLSRANDGTYRIAEKTNCDSTCPPL